MYFFSDDSTDSSPEGGMRNHSSDFIYIGAFCPETHISAICCPLATLFLITRFMYAFVRPQSSTINLLH